MNQVNLICLEVLNIQKTHNFYRNICFETYIDIFRIIRKKLFTGFPLTCNVNIGK